MLRGLDSAVPFLRNVMIQWCCPKDVAEAYLGGAMDAKAWDEARQQLNTYTTTLHAINSAIVKLSKLTVATTVYRGVQGMALPPRFWEPNEFGVKGGIEGAFLSTTLKRAVAMQYASSGQGAGIVFELPQGMVDRGADIAFLSQYPHEKEILFGPLTGLEVRATRVEGAVLVVEVALSINLASLTIEQVLDKRRKVVADMCEQLEARVRREAQEWHVLRGDGEERTGVPRAVKAFLKERLQPVAKKEVEHYNENAPLGDAIREAVAMADLVSGWPEELEAVAQWARREGGEGGEGGEGVRRSAAQLVRAEGALALSGGEKGDAVPIEVAHGLGALLWARGADAPLSVDLSERKLGAAGAAALGRALTPTLASLALANSDCANSGGDPSGLLKLCEHLADARASAGLTALDLSNNQLGANVAKALAAALASGLPVLAGLKYAALRLRSLPSAPPDTVI